MWSPKNSHLYTRFNGNTFDEWNNFFGYNASRTQRKQRTLMEAITMHALNFFKTCI